MTNGIKFYIIVYNKSKTLYGLYHAKETIKEIKEAQKQKDLKNAQKLDKARGKIKKQLSKTYKKENIV